MNQLSSRSTIGPTQKWLVVTHTYFKPYQRMRALFNHICALVVGRELGRGRRGADRGRTLSGSSTAWVLAYFTI